MDISQYTGQSLFAPRPAAIRDAAPPQHDAAAGNTVSESGGLFEQLVDTVNPLQHIPGVGTAYRAITDDAVSPLSAMAGGFLFGGPLGLAAGAAGSFLEMLTGKSLAQHAQALFGGDEPTGDGIETAAAGATGEPLLRRAGALSLEQYQAFAEAAGSVNTGFGAKATQIGWAENVWTQHALKQATGQYEANQQLGGAEKSGAERIA